jgi:Mn-containing catalase
MPEGVPMTIAPERREEFSPGLDPELLALIQATAEVEIKATEKIDAS